MRKVAFAFFAVLGAILSFTSCEEVLPVEEAKVSVLAVLENGRVWKTGDEVIINGSKYVVENGGESSTLIEGVAKANAYYAAYDTGNGSIAENELSVELPTLQSSSISMAEPMVASNGSPNLMFKSILGRMNLSIAGSGIITKVVLTSNSGKIAGNGTVALNFTNAPSIKMLSDASNAITVDLGKGVTLPCEVEVVVPSGVYEGFMCTVYDADGGAMIGKEISALEIVRGGKTDAEIDYIPDGEAPVYVTASIEAAADGSVYEWVESYPLYVNGVPAMLTSVNGSSAEFGPVAAADVYYASTSSGSANGMSGSQMRIKLAKDQSYRSSLAVLNPAVGKSENQTIALQYLAGIATLEVTGPHNLREIVLAGKGNTRLAGNGVVDMTTDTYRMSLNADASKEVRIDCGTAGVDVTNGATFRFVIPADDYSNGFTVSMTDTNGQVFSEEIDGGTVTRNAITSLGSIEWASTSGDNNNLSRTGCANSYMVHMAGTYSFLTRHVDNTPINNIAKVDWLWATKVDGATGNVLVSDISYANGEVTFTASDKEGNVLLAAFNNEGEIVWSWHIWLTDAPETIDCENNVIYQSNGQTDGWYVMDRNLGATDATVGGGYETFGLYYQWGRKDPFIGSKAGERFRNSETGDWDIKYEVFGEGLTVNNDKYAQAVWTSALTTKETGTIEYADAHPMHFMYAEATANQANWLAAGNFYKWMDCEQAMWRPFQKTNADPCPPGYQVPRNGMWNNVVYSYQFIEGKGIIFTNTAGKEVWYPFAGYRSAHLSDQGALIEIENKNGWLAIWSSELMVSERSYAFKYNDPVVFPNSDGAWGYGYNVRCVAEY